MKMNWRPVLQIGLISGIFLLYLGLVGILGAFIEREVVQNTYTLAQLILILVPFATGFLIARRLLGENTPPLMILLGALVAGILSVLPTALIMFFGQWIEFDSILVSLNRDWLVTVSFDNRDNILLGILYLTGFNIVASVLGAGIRLLPDRFRSALLNGLIAATLISVFGKTLSLILPPAIKDWMLSRETVRQLPALIILITCLILSFAWTFFAKTKVGQNGEKWTEKTGSGKMTTQQMIAWGLFGIFLVLLPVLVGRSLSLTLFTVGLYILMGLGLNISIGLAGMLDLGYVTSFAVGAYTMAVLSSGGNLGLTNRLGDYLTEQMGMPIESISFFLGFFSNFWVALVISVLLAMLIGFMFALPILKMRGDYLAIATLGFGQIIGALVGSDWLAPTLGGAQGILNVPRPIIFGYEFANPEQLYYIVLAACALVFYATTRLANSRTGRQWMAIREDEDVAAAMGIDVPRSKMLAFTLAASAGGMAGGIFAAQVTTAFPNSFEVLVSINVLALIIVGGLGSNRGIILGALVLVGMPELLKEFSDFRFLIYGILLIVMMLYRPEGLLPSTLTARELRADDENVAPAAGD
jgi:branched-chain amino acid transport system permease protein